MTHRCSLLLVLLLTGCSAHQAVPETITLEGGASVRHEVDQAPVKQNTALVRVQWRLK